MTSFGPVGDNWSRRPSRPQPRVLGVDLNSRRTVMLLLLAGTALSALILTGRYNVAHPDDHPYGSPTHIGLQAYEASFKAASSSSKASTDPMESGESQYDWGSEWGSLEAGDWDDDGQEESQWLLPYKDDGWDPTAPLPAPLTEVTLKSCVLPPSFYDLCAPTSSKKEDATRGKWVRVDRDLNKRIGLYYLYLFERRLLPNSQAPVLTELALLEHKPAANDLSAGGVWNEVSETIRQGVWPKMKPMMLHYKTTSQDDVRAARRASASGNAGELEPITELDVLYGGEEVQPLWGYEAMKTFISGGSDDDKKSTSDSPDKGRAGSRIAYRRAPKALPAVPSLRFSPEGDFTILQVADLHFSVGPGLCRDMDQESTRACKKVGADKYSLEWLNTALDTVKPDLVVLSGDQLNGQDTSWSSQSTIMKWAPVLWKRQIPWTIVFGNHDGELDLIPKEQMALMRKMPYFMGEAGPEGVDGTGNYFRSIRSHDSSNTTLFNLYFLDTHATAKSLNPWQKGYDWLKANQINWFKGQSSRVMTHLRPYNPPSSAYGYSSSSQKGSTKGSKAKSRPAKPLPDQQLSRPLSPTTFEDDRRLVRRQIGTSDVQQAEEQLDALLDDPTASIDDVEKMEEIVEELEEKEETSAVSADPPASRQGGGYRPAVEPYDPADAKQTDDGDGFSITKGGKTEDGAFISKELEDTFPPQEGGTAPKPAVMPYDPNDAKVTDDDEYEFEHDGKKDPDAKGTGDTTIKGQDGPQEGIVKPEGATKEVQALDPFEMDGLSYSTPTVLPAGPTKAKPLTAKPNAIAFFHIPLPESYDAAIDVGADGKRLLVGERFEGSGAPKTNSGFFDQALLRQGELPEDDNNAPVDEFWEGEFSAPTSGRPEVKIVANGTHSTATSVKIVGASAVYGYALVAAVHGYGGAGFTRRMRVFQISEYGERVETYKLLDTKEKLDLTVLVGEDALGEAGSAARRQK